MAIKKYKTKSYNKNNSKSKSKSKSKSSKKFKLSRKYHNKKKTQKRTKYNIRSSKSSRSSRNSKNHKNHKGGFSSNCNLATIKEPGFSVDALGSIAGLSIPESRAAIYRPNCKTNSYQAMTP